MTEPVVSIAIDLALPSVKRVALIAAVRAADDGVFVSREAVDRWVDRWGADEELPFPSFDIFPVRG